MIYRQDGQFHEWFVPKLAAVLGSQRYLELGVWTGGTFAATTSIVLTNGGTSVGVDTDLSRISPPPGAKLFEMDTDTFFLHEQPQLKYTYDLVFIDADHAAHQVRNDVLNVLPWVEDNGIILLHDTFPLSEAQTEPGYSGDAWRVAHELGGGAVNTGGARIESVTLPFGPGLTIIRKRVHQTLWSSL